MTPPGYQQVFEELHIPEDVENVERDADQNVRFVNCKRSNNVSPPLQWERSTISCSDMRFNTLVRTGGMLNRRMDRTRRLVKITPSTTSRARPSPPRTTTAQCSCSRRQWEINSHMTGPTCCPTSRDGLTLSGSCGKKWQDPMPGN
jgi:hypothetical protein